MRPFIAVAVLAVLLSSSVFAPVMAQTQQAQTQQARTQQAQTQAIQPKTNPATAPLVGVVDVQRILQESTAAQAVRQQLEEGRKNFQNEISMAEEKLRQQEGALQEQIKSGQANDKTRNSQRELEKQVRDLDLDTRQRQKNLLEAFDAAMGHVRIALNKELAKLASERGFSVVLVKEQTLWVADGLDLTDDILLRLNKNLPSVKVDILPVPVK